MIWSAFRDAMWDRMERLFHPFGNTLEAPGDFGRAVRYINQAADPLFGFGDSCNKNALLHKTMHSGMVDSEIVLLYNGKYYYGVFRAEFSLYGKITNSWHCVRQFCTGDPIWKKLEKVYRWETATLAKSTIEEILQEASHDTGGSFEDDPVWQSIREDESRTYFQA